MTDLPPPFISDYQKTIEAQDQKIWQLAGQCNDLKAALSILKHANSVLSATNCALMDRLKDRENCRG